MIKNWKEIAPNPLKFVEDNVIAIIVNSDDNTIQGTLHEGDNIDTANKVCRELGYEHFYIYEIDEVWLANGAGCCSVNNEAELEDSLDDCYKIMDRLINGNYQGIIEYKGGDGLIG